eukprot:TRINITY_DN4388_c0_g2_i1.p1 TRINITY_DN4388_c0_g2~~TRINITY_DN4388_c0_g2_i1.p1  ORF type:complete len:956 (+),score=202.74 TRINITY_DN4388_c0_g2_i1:242-3109(+)
MASAKPGNPAAPIILHFEWTGTSVEATDKALAALKTSVDHQVAHCPAVQTYSFRRLSGTVLRMTEVYQDANIFWNHVPRASHVEEKLQALFDPSIRANSSGVGVGDLSEGIEVSISMMKGTSSPLVAGFVARSGIACGATSPSFLVLNIPSGFANEASTEFTKSKVAPIIRLFQEAPAVRTCALFRAGQDATVLIISDSCGSITGTLSGRGKSLLEPLFERFDATKFSAELSGDVSVECKEQFTKIGIKFDCYPLAAGYVVHPSVLAGSYVAPKQTLAQNTVEDSSETIPAPPTISLFEIVNDPHSGEPKMIRFAPNAPGRSAHKYSSTGSSASVKSTAEEGSLEVPLLHVVRKLSSYGATDIELPLDRLYGLLERLRWWQRSLVLLNRFLISTKESSLSPEEQYQVERFVQILSGYGYPPRAKDTSVMIPGLDVLIQSIEWVWRDSIQPARESLASTAAGQIAYRALMEAFPIGSYVIGQAGGLAGAPVAYRVIDSYMSSQRSMFGGTKFNFTLGLEFVVNFGEHFCVCAFEEKIEEYEGDRDLSTLPLVPLNARPHDGPVLQRRGKDVAALGTAPVYRAYSSGSFFAHRSARDGSAAAGLHQAGAGRCMVDNERGLLLGHAPGVSFDGAGTAIQNTLKVYRVAVRAGSDNDSEAAKQERIKNAQLQLFKHLPEHMELITWPAVVAYSFTWKTWGHVLSSGLSPIQFSDEPWEQLVLPTRTKELLFASARYNLSGAPGVSDIIKGKSQGALYLLYGPPGTGKTLTVEAISEKFRLPLYTVSLGELGTSAQEVDGAINNILSLCAQWKAIVLLDEGDALLEQREKGHLQLNSLTGVLLRSLENFDGQLYITSNRLQHIDRAVLSRVTLALKYDALDAAARSSLWRNTLKRANVDLSKVNIDKLASYEVSGRELLHVVKLALALAYHRESTVSQDIIEAALEESLEFRSHFPDNKY